MKIRLMNMVKIFDPKTGKVVVLDKKKKEGWEGLTFPGGKVEENESFEESVIREAKEETNLDIKNPRLLGIITRIFDKDGINFKDVGLIYETNEFKGQLEPENREGHLFRQDYQTFKKMDGMSDSMPYILKIYDGEVREIFRDRNKGTKIYK